MPTRRGDVIEEGERELFAIGEQPGMRHFDIAPRNRNRVTILGSVTPAATFSLNASFAAGKDDYLESLFGLRDNTHRVYGVGVDVVPTEPSPLAGSYSYERYNALSRSRQANPPSSSSTDPFNRTPFNYDTFLTFPQDSNQVPQAGQGVAQLGDRRARSRAFLHRQRPLRPCRERNSTSTCCTTSACPGALRLHHRTGGGPHAAGRSRRRHRRCRRPRRFRRPGASCSAAPWTSCTR